MKEDFTYCDKVTSDFEKDYAFVGRHLNEPMNILCFDTVRVYPFSKETKEYQGELITEHNEVIKDIYGGLPYDEKRIIEQTMPTEEYMEQAIYLGPMEICWGHYFTEGISKLWCLQTPQFKELLAKGVPICFVSKWHMVPEIPRAWAHLIDLLSDTKLNIIPLQKPTSIGKAYVPTNSFSNKPRIGRVYTDLYVQSINRLRDKALQNAVQKSKGWKKYEKIYLSRTKLKTGIAEFGERSIERLFKNTGYHIIHPEQLSFEQQVYLLWNAKEVVATMGSISHNLVFCKPNTRAIIIRKSWFSCDYQYAMNQIAELNVEYIDAHLSVFVTPMINDGPFYIYRNENIIKWFMDNYGVEYKTMFNRRLFSKYAMLCIAKNDFEERRSVPHYYYEKMYEELKNNQNFYRRIFHKLLSLLGDTAISRQLKSFSKRMNR